MADNRSKKVLISSIERRMRHAMVRALEEFDKRFSETEEGNLFKVDIKHSMNDMIRATRDELGDYDIEYRPVKIRPDNTLSMTTAFMESIQRVVFTDNPFSVTIEADRNYAKLLEALRSELGVGVTFLQGEKVIYAISSIKDCLLILPFFDRYRLVPKVRAEYVEWRVNLVYSYIRS